MTNEEKINSPKNMKISPNQSPKAKIVTYFKPNTGSNMQNSNFLLEKIEEV